MLSVSFTPNSGGAASGTLTISDNSPSSPHILNLLGTSTSPSFTIRAASGNSTTATVAAGQTATYNLSLAGTPGFGGSVTLVCTGAPTNATCSISPSSVTLTKGGSANFTVSIATQITITASVSHSGTWTGLFGVLAIFGLPLAFIIGKPISRHATVGAIVLIGLVTFTSIACGGGGGQTTNPPKSSPTTQTATTPQGTYTVTVTASAGAITASQPLTLKVQ